MSDADPRSSAYANSIETDPDPMAAFEPASEPALTPPWEEPPTAPDAPEIKPEPAVGPAMGPAPGSAPAAPAGPRPMVKYIGKGGDRVYALLYPLAIEGRHVRSITIRHPTLWDVWDWLDGRIKTNFSMMARMTGMSEVDLGALRWPDAQALLSITATMLPDFVREAIEAQAGAPPPQPIGEP